MALVPPAAKIIPLWLSVSVSAGMTALSVGYRFLTQQKGTKGISKKDWDSNIVSTEQHLPVIYGKARIGISPVFISSGENTATHAYNNIDWLFCIAAICHGRIESIEKVILNNEEKHSIIGRNENGDIEIDEHYQGFAHFGWRPGKTNTIKVYKEVKEAFPKWDDDHLGSGVASIYMNLRYDPDKFPAGIPNVTVLVKGTRVHDPRDALYPNDTSAYSTNPALCVLDYLTNTTYGVGAESDEIDINSFIIAANYCDQLLSSTTIDYPSAPSAQLIDTDCKLWTGKSQKYSYAYAFGTLSSTGENNQPTWSEMSALSAISSCTVSKAYGAVRLSGIDTNATYSRIVFRKELATNQYKYIGMIDPDDDTTIFDDNVIESELGTAHSVVSPPSTPGVFTAAFRDFTTSALDASRYYRYKVTYETASGESTEASDASNKIKTKANKKAVKLKIPISDDSKVTVRKIYRTHGLVSGETPAAVDYKLLATISNNTQETYIDLLDDPTGASAPSTNNTTVSQVKMFTCNGILDTSRDVLANLEDLLSSCRGRLFYESGKYTIAIRTTAVPEVFELNEDNIIGDWNYRTPGAKDVCNIIKASWTNPDQNWQTDYVIWPSASDNNLYLGDDYGFKISKEIDLPFTVHKRMAKQIAQVVRKETRQGIMVTLTAKEEALKLKANTVVKLTHSSPGWTDKLFWVDAIKILPNATVGLALTEYDATVYNYEIINADTLGGADTTLPNPNDPPDEVTNVTIVEEVYGLTPTQITNGEAAVTSMPNWRLKITYTDPASNFWHHSDVYVKKGSNIDATTLVDSHKYIQVGQIDRNSNGVFYIYSVEPFITYYVKFVSISTFAPAMLIDDATEWSHTIEPALPSNVGAVSAVNKGNDATAEGKNFEISWGGVTRFGSGFSKNSVGASIPKIIEEISYDVEVYLSPSFTINGTTYLGIADSVLLNNGKKVNTQLLGTYNTKETKFTYTYENNISDINKLFENQTTNANYETFYGHAQRTLKFVVYTKDTNGRRSKYGSSILLHNPAPVMTDINGTTITPEFKEGLSSVEFSWEHPFAEIDISHFMSKLVGKATNDSDYDATSPPNDTLTTALNNSTLRKNSTAYAVGAFVFPKPANGHLYICQSIVGNSKTASTQQVFAKPSTSNGKHPTTTDGNVTWKHYCMLRFQKTFSEIDVSINSAINEEDIAKTSYTAKFNNLDPKKSFRYKVTPYDVYGAGTRSNIVTAVPGTTQDITEDEDIDAPEQVTGTGTGNKIILSINSNNNVVIQWNKPSGNNATDVTKAIIDWRARQGITGTPVLAVRPTGDIPTLGDVDEGNYNSTSNLVIGEKKSREINLDETETHTSNKYIIKGAKVGYTYFAKVRFENSSKKQGAWSAWAYNTTAVTGLSSDDFDYDFKKYVFTGTFSATDIDTVSWSTGTLQFKNTNGTTTNYTISNAGNTGNMTEAMWIVWPGDAPNANTKFKALTSAQYLAATGKTPMAFAQKGDTGQVAFFSRFSDKKDFAINSSFVSAGSIITAHLAAASVEASKMNINGTLTMGHSSGAKMLFQDSSSVNRIKISATNGGTPKMIVSKSGIDADTATDPDDMLFSTDYNSFKINTTDSGSASKTFSAATVSPGSVTTQTAVLDASVGSTYKGVIGWALYGSAPNDWIRNFPFILHTNGTSWQFFEVAVSPSNGNIIAVRRIFNSAAAGDYSAPEITMTINWFLLDDTLS